MRKTTTTASTMTTTTNNKSIGSRYLTNYIRNVQQASKGTAAQYEYRLLKFERYVMTMPSKEKQQQELQQQQNQEIIITLDDVINEKGLIVQVLSRSNILYGWPRPARSYLFVIVGVSSPAG
jgi:hypothetical protein